MKKYILLWLVFNFSLLGYAQTLSVLEKESGQAMEFVTIVSEHLNKSTITNAEGKADVSKFKGFDEIQIRSLGYKTQVLSFSELEKQEFVVYMSLSNLNLDEVVISATRWQQNNTEIPSKITSIGPKEIALQNPQTAADLLGISNKVFIQKSQQGGGSPIIRGFATNRLVYTIDGVRMNTAIFRGGNLQNVINLDPFAVENTEVLFGPGSVIYGSDAIGGVMSFQTLNPQLSLTEEPLVTGKAVARYSSANKEQTGHFDVNVGWKKWAFVSSFSSWDYDHLRQGSNGPGDYVKDYYVQRQDSMDVVIKQDDPLLQIPSAYSQQNIMQKIRFKPNEAWDFQYGFHYSETSPYGRYDRHNRRRNGSPRYAEWNYGAQSWMMNNLTITHKGENNFYDQMTLRLAQQVFEESRISRDLNRDDRETREEEVYAYSANLDFLKATGSTNKLFYGVEIIQNDVFSKGINTDISTGVNSFGASRYPDAIWQSAALYLNDEYDVSEKFVLQGGLRYNLFALEADFSDNTAFYPFPFEKAKIDNGALTGSIGGVYRPAETWVIKANFGTAFRSPNVDDIGKVFDSEPGAVVVPNPDLEAEYAYNLDLGIAKVIGERVKIDVTGYYTILQNALVRRDYQLNGEDSISYDGTFSQVQALQNAAEATVYGIQAGLEVKLPAGFSFSSDFNYQFGEEELDDGTTSPSRHAPPVFGSSRLTYQAKKLRLQFYALYQGERSHNDMPVGEQNKDEIYALNNNGETYAPAWYILNIKAMYDISEQFSVSAGMENITDQRYRPYSSGISGAGRNFVMAVTAKF
ncbi:MAG: TonB-dependent receptor [Vicingaceae bacterium]